MQAANLQQKADVELVSLLSCRVSPPGAAVHVRCAVQTTAVNKKGLLTRLVELHGVYTAPVPNQEAVQGEPWEQLVCCWNPQE